MSGNFWGIDESSAYVHLRDVVRLRASNEQYDTEGTYAVFIEGTSNDNRFVNSRFSNSRSAANNSTFRTYSAGTTNTTLLGCSLHKGTGGEYYDAISSAELTNVYYSQLDTSFTSDLVRSGTSWKKGFYKTAAAYTTTITVTLPGTSSWMPAMVSLRVKSIKSNTDGIGYTENRLYLRHLSTTNVVVVSNQVIGTASNLVITTGTSGNTLTITCTNGSHTGVDFIWDVEVDSLYTPTVS
jgi:hypothetical protein